MNIENPNEEILSEYDETRIPDEFITSHIAEGENIHTLKVGDFEIPVSFIEKDGRFCVTGQEAESKKGAILSGRITGEEVKINHIEIDEALRGVGMGSVLLSDLEAQFKSNNIKKIYAAFFNSGTVTFFLKNKYNIVPASSLTEDTKKALKLNTVNFDTRISSIEEFEKGKDRENPRQILLTKQL